MTRAKRLPRFCLKSALRAFSFAGKQQKGSVAVLTLWVVIFLALLAVAIANNVSAHLQVVSDLKWTSRSHAMGMNALITAIELVQNDPDPTCDTIHDAWASDEGKFRDVAFEDGTFSIVHQVSQQIGDTADIEYGLTDEARRVNLNKAPAPVLSLLFQECGMTQVKADELAYFIVDWRDEDTTQSQNMGLEACANLSPPYRCKNADFESMEELWWMPGMTASFYEAIQAELTLYGAWSININTASELALRSLNISSVAAERIISWRSEPGNFFKDPSDIIIRAPETGISEEDKVKLGTAVASGWVGTSAQFFRGTVMAKFGNRSRKVSSFIVSRTGELKWWKE